MKTLPLHRDEKKSNITVECVPAEVSVYTRCAYCIHCKGIRVGGRLYPAPQEQAWNNLLKGGSDDETLMNAALQFNMLVRDGESIDCDDDMGSGYTPRYR